MPDPHAITFAGASVENATRGAVDPSTTTPTLDAMDVWAFLNMRDGLVLSNEDVVKKNGAWTYTNVQYWIPGEQNTYYFAAFAPMNSANWSLDMTGVANDNLFGAGTVSFTNVDGTEDLLYAATKVAAPTSTTQEMDPVKFQFSHLLSKVKFTFTNGFTTNNADIRVKNIKMTAPKSATIDLAVENWWDGDDWKIVEGEENTLTLNFVNADRLDKGQSAVCEYERLTIPAGVDQVYNISFDVEVYMGTVLANTFKKTSTVTGVALEMGKAYNFVTEINPSNLNFKEIEFDVVVKDWVDAGDVDYIPGQVCASTAEELAAALTADERGINIMLTSDIDLPISSLGQITPGSGEYKLGGANTEYINLDLNGHTLNITNDYWSVLGAKNENAVFTIKNGTMTSSQATGTWNSYDLCFANCNYVIEDVVFEKAIALEAANKSYTLNNVIINETHDYYAMWISAKGQHVDINGLIINSAGRGIKIDEQYVSAPAKVTLCIDGAVFNTVKKAAIVVKSVEGAEINVEDIDITNVAADNVFAVWVDENSKAYADKVVVNGAYVKVEGQNAVIAATADDIANVAEGSIVLLTENTNYGSVTLGELKDVTIIGAEGAATIFLTDANTKLENVTVKNVDFEYNGTDTNFGVVINSEAQIDNLVLDGCTFVGTGEKKGRGIYGQNPNATIVLKNTTFENLGYPVYTMSAGGYKSLLVEGCTFSLIKSWAIMPQYNDYLGDLTVTGCTFENCTAGLVKAGKFTAGHTFTFTNNTITNSAEHPAKNWFTIDTTNATAVVSDNVKDGEAWTPGAAEGLK